jgi:hypothetical protein
MERLASFIEDIGQHLMLAVESYLQAQAYKR